MLNLRNYFRLYFARELLTFSEKDREFMRQKFCDRIIHDFDNEMETDFRKSEAGNGVE